MPLFIDTGFISARGARLDDPSCLAIVPRSEQELGHGALLAISEGLHERPAPETASRDALKTLGDHYYSAPENWGLKHALQESFLAANTAVVTNGENGRAAALSALVVRRRRWAVSHAGHTRVWLMRDNELKLLTRDHVTPRMRRTPQIDRACGLAHYQPDFASGEVSEGDVFVLTTAGVHDVLTGSQILACVVAEVSAAQAAAMIVERATKAGGNTNACACVARVEQVPPEVREDLEEDVAALPAIAPPSVEDVIDGFRIERLVHKSSRFRLYKAVDTQGGDTVALKFPNPRDAKDPGFAERFLREEWIGRRISSAYVLRTLPLKKGRRTVLYSVMAYPSGESLARRLARKGALPMRESAFLSSQLLEALAQLHDQGIIHNDVRPQNIVIEKSGNLMLLGLGSSHVAHTTSTADVDRSANSRRGSFLAPELFDNGVEPTVRSDIFAVGVTLYRMLTGKYPYGKIAAVGQTATGAYTPATRYRRDLPPALDAALARACALDPTERFESAQEFSEIIDGVMRPREAEPETKTPAARQWNWEMVSIIALMAGLFLYLVFALRR